MSSFTRDTVVLVTGSSRGLGATLVRAFHLAGASVVVNYFNSQDSAEALVRELTSQDTASSELPSAIASRADVTSTNAVQRLFDDAELHFKRPITIVVNNALVSYTFNGDRRKTLAGNGAAGIPALEWSDFSSQLEGNIKGCLNTVQAALPGFTAAGFGRVINIGTNLLPNPVVPYHDYISAKGALLGLTRSMAQELGAKNITVNMVAGGLLRGTDASADTDEATFQYLASVTPMQRVCTPEDLAGPVLFFAGSGSGMITGQNLTVDGGLVMI